jgi:hypothetical protein
VWAAFDGNATNPSANSCALYYSRAANMLYLENDSLTGASSAAIGTSANLQNSQCSVNMANTGVVINGSTLVLNVAMTFSAGYSGTRNIYLWAADAGGTNTGWQARGSWTIANALVASVTADSVTPGSGSGLVQSFALQYSDTAGAASLATVWAQFSTAANNLAPNSCELYYSAANNILYLLNDTASSWNAGTLGGRRILQNSQCSVNTANSTVAMNGNTLILNVATTFSPSYSGAKNIYLWAADAAGANTGWQVRGSWNVSTAPGTAP